MWEAAGGYDENMPVQGVEDWEFWLNSYSKGFKFLYVNMVAFDYASRSDSMLANAKIKENWIRNEEYLYKKYAILLKEHYREYCRWDFHGRELRTKPLRTIFRLVANAFFPRLHRKFYKLSNDAH